MKNHFSLSFSDKYSDQVISVLLAAVPAPLHKTEQQIRIKYKKHLYSFCIPTEYMLYRYIYARFAVTVQLGLFHDVTEVQLNDLHI